MNEDKEKLKKEFEDKFCESSFPNEDGTPFLDNGYYSSPDNHLSDKIADFWLNKIKESNKALLTKLRGEIEIKRKKLNPLDRSDDFSRNIAFNQAIDQDIALIDKYIKENGRT